MFLRKYLVALPLLALAALLALGACTIADDVAPSEYDWRARSMDQSVLHWPDLEDELARERENDRYR